MIIVILISIVVSILWLMLIKRFETSSRLTGKPSVIIYLFIIGISSTFVSLHFRDFEYKVLPFIVQLSSLSYNVLCVGLCEEFAKFAVFYTAASITDITKEPKDGLLQAAAVALGFSIFENITYSGFGLGVLLLRSIQCVVGHISFAVIWGYAAGLYLFSKRAGKNEYGFGMVIGAVCTSAVFHGLYNYFFDIGFGFLSYAVVVIVVSISVYLLKYLKNRSPYQSENSTLVKDAMDSNPGNFQLNRQAGLHALKAGKYDEGLGWLKKAEAINRKELSTRVFVVFAELLTGEIDEFEAYRKVDKRCASLSAFTLHKLKDRTSEVFGSSEKTQVLLRIIDDIITAAGQREFYKRRVQQVERFIAESKYSPGRGGFLISDKDSLPMAFRHPEFYKDEVPEE